MGTMEPTLQIIRSQNIVGLIMRFCLSAIAILVFTAQVQAENWGALEGTNYEWNLNFSQTSDQLVG